MRSGFKPFFFFFFIKCQRDKRGFFVQTANIRYERVFFFCQIKIYMDFWRFSIIKPRKSYKSSSQTRPGLMVSRRNKKQTLQKKNNNNGERSLANMALAFVLTVITLSWKDRKTLIRDNFKSKVILIFKWRSRTYTVYPRESKIIVYGCSNGKISHCRVDGKTIKYNKFANKMKIKSASLRNVDYCINNEHANEKIKKLMNYISSKSTCWQDNFSNGL